MSENKTVSELFLEYIASYKTKDGYVSPDSPEPEVSLNSENVLKFFGNRLDDDQRYGLEQKVRWYNDDISWRNDIRAAGRPEVLEVTPPKDKQYSR